jgi:hypothetical protein
MKRVLISESQLRSLIAEISSQEIDIRANEADTHPSEAQKEAGNYKMGHISVNGMQISIENPRGSKRYYKNPDGSQGYNVMKDHYGYFNITKGKDGDAVDVFIGPEIDIFENVYCVDQNNKEGEFDETKVMLGYLSKEEAKAAYMSNYSPDWKGFRSITGVSLRVFKKWLYRGRKQRQPFAEYVEIQKKKLTEGVKIANPAQHEKFMDQVEHAMGLVQHWESTGGKSIILGRNKWEKVDYTINDIARELSGTESLRQKAAARAIQLLQAQEGVNLKYFKRGY